MDSTQSLLKRLGFTFTPPPRTSWGYLPGKVAPPRPTLKGARTKVNIASKLHRLAIMTSIFPEVPAGQ